MTSGVRHRTDAEHIHVYFDRVSLTIQSCGNLAVIPDLPEVSVNYLLKQSGIISMNWNANLSSGSRPSIGAPFRPFPARASRETPVGLANGNESLVSARQEPQFPSLNKMKTQWKQQIVAARIAWARLSADELIKLDGNRQELALLIQERYVITPDEAEKRVKRFFDCR